MSRDMIFSLCSDMDVRQVEMELALDALDIIQESLDAAKWSGASKYANALCSVSNTLSRLTQSLQESAQKIIEEVQKQD